MQKSIYCKMKLTLIFKALLISVVLRAEVSVKYYYLPLDAETYIPATEENIKEASSFKGELQEGVAEYFLRTASHAKRDGNFDPNNVRLLIESSDGNNVIFIDRFAVAKNKGKEYSVNPNIFSALERGLDMKYYIPPHETSYKDWLKIRSLREEIPGKLHEDQRDWSWLNFTYGLASGALATFLAMLISKRRKLATP